MALQRDALRGGVGGQQHPHRELRRRLLPLALDPLPLLRAGRAIKQLHPPPGDPAGGETLLQVALRGSVLRKDDHALITVGAGGADVLLYPIQQPRRARILADRGRLGPGEHLIENRQLLRGGAAGLGRRRGVDRLPRRLTDAVV